jgi:hypothetical protein
MARGHANESSDAGDRDLLQSPTGRIPPTDEGAPDARLEEIRSKSRGTRPIGDVTNVLLSGGGDEETLDGLDENAEQLRHAAEDLPDELSPYATAPDASTNDQDLLTDQLAENNLEEPLTDDERDPGDADDVPVFDRGSLPTRGRDGE